ncbi:hypothetical protein ACIOMM_35170 [Streptomyces sp. NPDC087908]|uniref:hypothetical protein n=1 Tax=unclassified Streptomyces TaxID=2593676 RepID=UPI0011CE4670|nr:hypothetical protein [Streptomyces sp. adm13(2018)]MYS08982.1 hypothetical protein [Streptomyces sp. SID6041]TXS11561.1 hypothetical protein EAO70_32115 [Streptomyces sp. adm13(2018)]
MYRRIAAALATAATAGALALGTAGTAEAAGPGFYARSHHSSYAECQAAGVAGRPLWGALFLCEPFAPSRPDVYVLWVRY